MEIQMRRHVVDSYLVIVGKPLHDCLWLLRIAVDLGAIARRQNRGLLRQPLSEEIPEGPGQHIHAEDEPLANGERSSLVVESNGVERHGRDPAVLISTPFRGNPEP